VEAELKESIDRLRGEIAGLGEGDAAARERLSALIAKIEQKLDAAQEDDDESLLAHVQEGIAEFETSHPTITETISSIATTLSNMGI
jgi:hypothetical protein